jgi:MFS transporter, SP family, arabinose:H+ symporter
MQQTAERHDAPVARSSTKLWIATLVSSLGGLLFGYDNIVISGAIHSIQEYFHLDAIGLGWAAGCALIGCLLGSATAGGIADRFGHRVALGVCALCFGLSSVGVWASGSWTSFVFWRIVGGVGIGSASIVAPMHIAEIAPARHRGRLVTLYQLGIVLGILSAVFVNMLIQRSGDEAWNIHSGWRWMFLAGVVPAVLFGAMMFRTVESPRWLLKVGRRAEALHTLSQLSGESAAQQEVAQIEVALGRDRGELSELFRTGLRRALLIGILLAGLSQASGITPLFSYLPEVFRAAGAATGDAFLQSVLVGLVNTVFTLVAVWLVDVVGRRTLILFGTAAQFVAFLTVGFLYRAHADSWSILACVMAFVAAHAVGNGAVCWVIISEIFPTKLRGRAMSIATTSLWVFAYLGNQVFPLLQSRLESSGTFWCFSGAALLNFAFVLWFVPELKNRPLEEIEAYWTKGSPLTK